MKLKIVLSLMLFTASLPAVAGELSLRYGVEFVVSDTSSYSSHREALLDFGVAYAFTRNLEASAIVGIDDQNSTEGITNKVDLSAQYRFLTTGTVRPFAQGGLTYVAFSKENCHSELVAGYGGFYSQYVCDTEKSSGSAPVLATGVDIMLSQKRMVTLTLSRALGNNNLGMTLLGLSLNYY